MCIVPICSRESLLLLFVDKQRIINQTIEEAITRLWCRIVARNTGWYYMCVCECVVIHKVYYDCWKVRKKNLLFPLYARFVQR